MPVNGFLKIPSDMSHPLPRALENVFHRYDGAPSRTMLLGESCGEPSSSPCYVTSSTFPGTELGLLKCFVEMQASAAVSAPPAPPTGSRKDMTLCQRKLLQVSGSLKICRVPDEGEEENPKSEINSVAGL